MENTCTYNDAYDINFVSEFLYLNSLTPFLNKNSISILLTISTNNSLTY